MQLPQPSLLTPRQREIAGLIACGYSNKRIAHHLAITESSATHHVVRILRRLGFQSRAQIAVWAVQHGCLPHN